MRTRVLNALQCIQPTCIITLCKHSTIIGLQSKFTVLFFKNKKVNVGNLCYKLYRDYNLLTVLKPKYYVGGPICFPFRKYINMTPKNILLERMLLTYLKIIVLFLLFFDKYVRRTHFLRYKILMHQ